MAVCLAISEIFSVKEWCDLENQVRGRSRSLNGGPSLLENIRNAITRLPMHRLGRNLGGRISSCSQWICYFSSYDGTGWYDSLVVASKQHLCCKTVSLVLVVTANRTVNVLVLWGVEIKKQNIHNFHKTWMTVPLWYKINIKSVRKTANINTKNLRSFITVKAHCS